MNKVILICGPTGIGKSSLALDLAQHFNFEIISGDSMQVYRSMNIGTAKATLEEMNLVPHHLVNIKNVDEAFSVADFQKLGREAIATIYNKNKIPLIVGGTGLYLKALLYDFNFGPEQEIKAFDSLSNEEIYEKLVQLNPEVKDKIHLNNRKRLVRALNLAKNDNLSFKKNDNPLYNFLCIGLTSERTFVYERINKRVDEMFMLGLEEEVRVVLNHKNLSLTAKQAIGYKEFTPYFEGKITVEEVKENIKQATRRYAKRQYTWFNNQLDVIWFDIQDKNYKEEVLKQIERFLNG